MQNNMVRVSEQDLARDDKNRCSAFINDQWLRHLDLANTEFTYNTIREEPKPGSEAKNIQQVQGLTFLDQIANNSRSPLGMTNFESASP